MTHVTMLLENDLYPQDVRVRDEARSLTAAGYRVHVIAPRGEGQARRELVDGVSVERFQAPRERGEGLVPLLLEYAVAHVQLYARAVRALLRGTDVLHFHNPPDTLFVPALLARRSVFDMHDLFPELLTAKFGRSRLLGLAMRLQRASARTADLVLVTNESQRELVLRRAQVAAERVVVVRNGPPASALQLPLAVREGPLRDPHLMYVGALEAQDGVDRISELIARLLPELPGVRLTVVGWGTRRQAIEAALRAGRLEQHVTFTGRVGHDEVLALISTADVCIDLAECSDLNHRTTMVKIAEYLALGKPTVSFALDETKATGGEAMLYAPCGDWDAYAGLVTQLAGDGELRTQLGRQARERAAALTWEHSAKALLEAYGRLIVPKASVVEEREYHEPRQ